MREIRVHSGEKEKGFVKMSGKIVLIECAHFFSIRTCSTLYLYKALTEEYNVFIYNIHLYSIYIYIHISVCEFEVSQE